MSDNIAQGEVKELIERIVSYWGKNASVIDIITHEGAPFVIFEVNVILYNKYNVMFEYEQSTVGISVKVGDDYMGLSRISKEPIIKGFKSCIPENLLHNFDALDKTLHEMN